MNILLGILIPLAGTSLGAACVLFMKKDLNVSIQKMLIGFASGVMVAASVWSLLIPSMEMSEKMGKLSFVPAVSGFLIGIIFLLLMDKVVPHMHFFNSESEGLKSSWNKTTKLVFAVILHNIPEGMAVGAVFAGILAGSSNITFAAAFALSAGIAIQNFPEGAIISMPLKGNGMSKFKAFAVGTASGVVEPIGALITILAAYYVLPLLPYFLSFAAGAMIYVVVEELIPETAEGKHSNLGTIGFAAGFSVMMVLDVALG